VNVTPLFDLAGFTELWSVVEAEPALLAAA
jgi:hypothetical protein